jgi:membrane protein DedA with SNARE-associated domain
VSDLLGRWPVWLAFVALFCVAFGRGGATYLVGRGLRAGGDRSALGRPLDRPMVLRAQDWIRRWGAPVVALAFLTVGIQTAVNAAAGTLRMPLRRYLPGLVVGALLWAGIYVTVGFAVVEALIGGLSWWVVALVVLAVAALVLGARWAGRRATEDPDGIPRGPA